MQRPGDNDVVEETDVQRDEDDREAHAWGGRAERRQHVPARLPHPCCLGSDSGNRATSLNTHRRPVRAQVPDFMP